MTQRQEVTDAAATQAKQQLDQMGYGVYANSPAEQTLLQRAEDNAGRAEELVKQLKADDFQQRASQVEQVIAEQPEEAQQNLGIWKRVMRTDPRYTKPIEGAGFIGTSINSEYMFMRATEIFGPIGTGWGYDVVEEKMFTGAPMSESVFEGGKPVGTRKASGLEFEENPPTFHEIRSLVGRLYEKEKGKEFAQKLLGHKSEKMTGKYLDTRGKEYVML